MGVSLQYKMMYLYYISPFGNLNAKTESFLKFVLRRPAVGFPDLFFDL